MEYVDQSELINTPVAVWTATGSPTSHFFVPILTTSFLDLQVE